MHSYINSPYSGDNNHQDSAIEPDDPRSTRKLLDKNNPRDVIEFSPRTQMFKNKQEATPDSQINKSHSQALNDSTYGERDEFSKVKIPRLDL